MAARGGRCSNLDWTAARRDRDGTIRRKRGDTILTTLQATYGQRLGAGFPRSATLRTILTAEAAPSLHQFVCHQQKVADTILTAALRRRTILTG